MIEQHDRNQGMARYEFGTTGGQGKAHGTKQCPRCGQELFEDMDVCYGCLYDFSRDRSRASQRSEDSSGATAQPARLGERDEQGRTSEHVGQVLSSVPGVRHGVVARDVRMTATQRHDDPLVGIDLDEPDEEPATERPHTVIPDEGGMTERPRSALSDEQGAGGTSHEDGTGAGKGSAADVVSDSCDDTIDLSACAAARAEAQESSPKDDSEELPSWQLELSCQELVTRIPLPKEGLLVGRDPACDLVLHSREVSRRHLRLVPEQEGVRATDCGATNPTLVDDAPLEGEQLLSQGAELRIGHVKIYIK